MYILHHLIFLLFSSYCSQSFRNLHAAVHAQLFNKMSDEDDDDTFVTIGTPFQPLEEDEGGEERKLVYAKQRKPGETYRERRERQRFHGAFTGGFSAGYFNTVGSKEGAWWRVLQLANRSCTWHPFTARKLPLQRLLVVAC